MSKHIKSPEGSYVWHHSEMTFGLLTFNLMEEGSVLVMLAQEQKSLHIQCVIMTLSSRRGWALIAVLALINNLKMVLSFGQWY